MGGPMARAWRGERLLSPFWLKIQKKDGDGKLIVSEPARAVRLEFEPPPNGVLRIMAPRANWKGFLRLSLVLSGGALSGHLGVPKGHVQTDERTDRATTQVT